MSCKFTCVFVMMFVINIASCATHVNRSNAHARHYRIRAHAKTKQTETPMEKRRKTTNENDRKETTKKKKKTQKGEPCK